MTILRLMILLFLALPAAAQTKIALVIGNSAYINAPALANPSNDAKAVAEKLQGIGFDVALYQDLDGQDFRKALGAFSEKALNANLVLVFYAGHGIEMDGQNYLIPVDAEMKSEATAQFEAVPLEQVLSTVRSAKKLGLVMLDACRNNPFAQTMTRKNGTRAVSRGLAPVTVANDSGLLVSFAAEPGSTADDGDTGHSPYTAALLEVLDQPGLEVSKMFRSVRAKVRQSTEGKQVPIEQMQLPDEDIFLVSDVPNPPEPAKGPSDNSDAVEVSLWQSAEKRGTRESFQAYLDKYPQGAFAAMAQQTLEGLGGTEATKQTTESAEIEACRKQADPEFVTDEQLSEAAIGTCRDALAAYPEDVPTMARLARALSAGFEYSAALPLAIRAADAGNGMAMYNLGFIYYNGLGDIERSDAEALRWYQAAAKAGNSDGMTALGDLYKSGSGVAKDVKQAVSWYAEAANAGNVTAMNTLGSMYLYGDQGVAESDSKALLWFRAAAEAGSEQAMYSLGTMYEDGRGVSRDPVRAAELYLASKQAGHSFFLELFEYRPPEVIREVQRLLNEAGKFNGAVNGTWGADSQAALDAYMAQK